MDRRIDAHIAHTQFGQLMDLAVDNNERFIRHGNGGIRSVQPAL